MRPRALAVLLTVCLVSCASPQAQRTAVAVDPIEPPAPRPSVAEQPHPDRLQDQRPTWDGFVSATGSAPTLAAYALSEIDVYESPESQRPRTTLDRTTILGTVTVLAVVTSPEDGWVEVMLPVRPNGSTGWVHTDQVMLYVVDGIIEVDLSERLLTYSVGGVEVVETEVGIGSEHNRTPVGQFFVTDNVTLADPDSPWGPHALGISARSDSITEYNGGDGIIGIHGTNNPGSIGGSISLGCVRVPNEVITVLHEMVPLGTRVDVTA